MEIYNLFLTIILIGAVCAGLGVLMDYLPNEPKYKQPLLYWLRKPFVDYEEEVERQRREAFNISVKEDGKCNRPPKNVSDKLRELKNRKLALFFYFKPLVLCVYCYPSFWGSLTFIALHGISLSLVPYLLISVIGAIPLTALFYVIYAKF